MKPEIALGHDVVAEVTRHWLACGRRFPRFPHSLFFDHEGPRTLIAHPGIDAQNARRDAWTIRCTTRDAGVAWVFCASVLRKLRILPGLPIPAPWCGSRKPGQGHGRQGRDGSAHRALPRRLSVGVGATSVEDRVAELRWNAPAQMLIQSPGALRTESMADSSSSTLAVGPGGSIEMKSWAGNGCAGREAVLSVPSSKATSKRRS